MSVILRFLRSRFAIRTELLEGHDASRPTVTRAGCRSRRPSRGRRRRGCAQETPARGGTLVVAISADPGHLNPAITTSGATHTAAELLYNGLLGRDERGDPVPDLAESWTIEQAGAVYRFRLARRCHLARRHAVHVGRRQVHLRGGAAEVSRADEGLDGRCAGRHRCPGRPNRHLPVQAAVRAPAAAARRHRSAHRRQAHLSGQRSADEPGKRQPVGTGPFKFVSYRKGAEIRLARNPTYFKRGCRTSTSS